MNKYYYDSYAILAYINKSENYVPYFSEYVGVTSLYNIMEVYYFVLREYGYEDAQEVLTIFRSLIITPTLDDVELAMHFKLKHRAKKLSYVDCLGYALARKLEIPFLTGDEGFRAISHVEFVKE
ncbi:MAG: PIN domain-containing protein [bacterium]|nr:PIN domain-containing protein [bacterium]